MNYAFKSVSDLNPKGKRVIVRCDFDVPIDSAGEITDDTRLISAVSTIEYLLENGAIVFLIGHMGRPNGIDLKLSLINIAKWFAEKFPESEILEESFGNFSGWKIKDRLFILENLRFEANEEENDSIFARNLSAIGEVFVNEAFGVSHRNHASIVSLPKLLPSYAGFHLMKEIKVLSKVLDDPKRPLSVILGGAKIETKLPLVSKMEKVADSVLVGGEIAHEARKELENRKVHLGRLNHNDSDLIEASVGEFINIILKSEMIVWNGPLGDLDKGMSASSIRIAEAIRESGAYSIVGGGDTVAFLNKNHLLYLFNFVSVGGGAMLEFLSGDSLPGLLAIETNS